MRSILYIKDRQSKWRKEIEKVNELSIKCLNKEYDTEKLIIEQNWLIEQLQRELNDIVKEYSNLLLSMPKRQDGTLEDAINQAEEHIKNKKGEDDESKR